MKTLKDFDEEKIMLGKKDKARYEVSSPRWGTTTPYRVLKMGKTSDSEIPCTQRTKINAKSGNKLYQYQ